MRRVFMVSLCGTLLGVVLASTAPAQTAPAPEGRPGRLYSDALYTELGEGDPAKALEIYRGIAERTQANPVLAARARYRMGVCHMKLRQLERAEACFEKLEQAGEGEIAALARQHLRRLRQARQGGQEAERPDEKTARERPARERFERALRAELDRRERDGQMRGEPEDVFRRRVEQMRQRFRDRSSAFERVAPPEAEKRPGAPPAGPGEATPGQGGPRARRLGRTLERPSLSQKQLQVLERLGIRPGQPDVQVAALRALADAHLRLEELAREVKRLRALIEKGPPPELEPREKKAPDDEREARAGRAPARAHSPARLQRVRL
ncbi:MAG: hypothetical protein AB1486_13645 [Planctomycetota bacterium]